MLEFQVYVKYNNVPDFIKIQEPASRGSLEKVLVYIDSIRDRIDEIGRGPSIVEIRAVV